MLGKTGVLNISIADKPGYHFLFIFGEGGLRREDWFI